MSTYPTYVQNISKWVEHYNPSKPNGAHLKPFNDSVLHGDTAGIAQEGHMSVAPVEARLPAPAVPFGKNQAVPAGLRAISSAQATVQQAAFDAKREEIEKSEASRNHNNKKKKTSTTKGKKNPAGKGKGKASKDSFLGESALLGTPGDIFKSKKVLKKQKKKK